MNDAFSKLAPFIQDYIYKNKWEELRDIQVASIDVILNTDDNLLLTSQTASGKTEAAFLPIITDIYNNPSSSVSVLYISPLKALINDQFERLNDILEEGGIPVYKWHGDVSQNKKEKLRKNPQGILQTTPESLEAMLTYRKNETFLFFSDLRYIVIDEIHYFISENRGIQLKSIMERISRISGSNPRIVGLSATVGNTIDVANWISEGTNRKTICPSVSSKKRTLHLSIDSALTEVNFYDKLYDLSLGKRCMIFSNSKEEVELNIAHLKKIAKNRKTKDVYFVHHGNVSGGLREFTERQMKESDDKIVTGATVTLELGIDVGDLERIIMTGSPFTVSSFVQRMGRSGRKNNISEMMFLFNKKDQDDTEGKGKDFVSLIDWDLTLTIAIIELYLKEHYVEPLITAIYPYPVLYHQIMCYITSRGSISPRELAEYMLTLTPFKNISQDDLKILLKHLLDIDHLEKDERGDLLIGLKGERVVNRYQFLTVFENEIEYSVRNKSEEIGTVSTPIPVGETLILAGDSWQVTELNIEKRQIFVKKINGISKTYWLGPTNTIISTKIVKKMFEVLKSNEEYIYLREDASKMLEKSRQIFKNSTLDNEKIVMLSNHNYAIFPHLGTKAFMTLKHLLIKEGLTVDSFVLYGIPLYLEVTNCHDEKVISDILHKIKNTNLTVEDLDVTGEFIREKNNEYLPSILLEKHYRYDFLNIEEVKKEF